MLMIFPEHQKYLGYAWPFSGALRYFTFTVFSFGLSSACFCVTKLLRPLAKRFTQRKEFDSSGLLVNDEKSCWVPMQVGEWLGFVINIISMTFRIPEKKDFSRLTLRTRSRASRARAGVSRWPR